MARKRKSAYDPNQLSLFDMVADSIEKKQEEKIRENIVDEPEPSVRIELVSEPEKQEENSEPIRLGINSDGALVYRMPDGSRMASHNLAIMRLVDGDKFSPEELYVKNRHEFLTIQEVSRFRNNTNLEVEAQNVRQANRPSGNRKNRSKTGNDTGREKRGLQQPSLFNSGSLGVEQPGRTDETGSPGENTLRSETIQPAAERSESVAEQTGAGIEESGFERLGDIANDGNRPEPENYRITPDDHLGSGGAKLKYADNITAIKLLRQFQEGNAELATNGIKYL